MFSAEGNIDIWRSGLVGVSKECVKEAKAFVCIRHGMNIASEFAISCFLQFDIVSAVETLFIDLIGL
jgi:hypothetical protein